jgi:hypothetical protein
VSAARDSPDQVSSTEAAIVAPTNTGLIEGLITRTVPLESELRGRSDMTILSQPTSGCLARASPDL